MTFDHLLYKLHIFKQFLLFRIKITVIQEKYSKYDEEFFFFNFSIRISNKNMPSWTINPFNAIWHTGG